MNEQITAKRLRAVKAAMASERDSTKEALDYAVSLVPEEHKRAVMIGLMVYHNTLLEQLACIADAYAKENKAK